jgi:hypothetical protein
MAEQKSPEQIELEDAQALVAKARQKVAAIEQAKLEAAAEAVAQYKARLEREEFEKRQWAEKINAEHAAKRQQEAEAQLAAQNAEMARLRHLENEFNRQEEAKQRRLAKEKEAARQTALAFELEKEAQMLEQEAIRQAIRQREQEAKRNTEFTNDVSLPVEQTTGIEESASAMEVKAAEWGNPALRRLFGRSTTAATEDVSAAPAPLPYQQEHPKSFGTDQGSVSQLLERWASQTKYRTREEVIAQMLGTYGFEAVSEAIETMIVQVGSPAKFGVDSQINIVNALLLESKAASE